MFSNLKSADFFVIGGTLERKAASYVQRPADDDLLRHTLEGEYCNVLAARQTGKSSLMVQTAERLKGQGIKPVIIDLTAMGSQITAGEWYFGLISYLSRHLSLNVDEQTWWNAQKEKSPVQRFSDFLHEVILNQINEPIVIFIDEIDSTLKLKFTDDFFAAIRAAYNARSQNADLKRLTFVLLGVARPTDLIKDRTRTPYNIGIGIDITDFQIDELGRFESILEKAYPRQGRQILEWVLEWTGGQPYLTQKLCSELVEQANGLISEDQLAQLVERLFLGDMARKETNLRSIRDQTKNNPHLARMLRIYKRLLANQQVVADEQSIEQNELKLAGLVKTTPQGILQVRNRIYRNIFGENWVKESMPVSTTQRLAVVTSIIAVLAIAVAGYSYYQQQNQTAEIQAETFINSFNNTNSPEVKITSLAGLFGLEGDYVTQARELFDTLNNEQQLALFDLTAPANVGNELVVVVGGVYQNVENTLEGNTLLKAMADTLAQTAAPGATTLTLEINAWLDARDAATRRDYPSSINLYTRAFEYSKDRNAENAAVLMERASIYTLREQYANALADYDNAVGIDAGRANEVQNAILGNQKLADYWREHSNSYSNLSSSIVIPTNTGIPTITLTEPTPERIPFRSPDNPDTLNPVFGWQPGNSVENFYTFQSDPYGVTIHAEKGTDQWAAVDSAPLFYYPIEGNFETQVLVIPGEVSYQTFAALGVRSTFDHNTWLRIGSVDIVFSGSQLERRIVLDTDNGGAGDQLKTVPYPEWTIYLKLIRQGDEFSFYYGSDGNTWTPLLTNYNAEMPVKVEIYLAVASWGKEVGTEADFYTFTVLHK